MIYDNLKNREAYRDLPDIYTALEFLASLKSPPAKPVELRGDALFANPVSLVSKPEASCVFEAHRRYIDIHCIFTGTEGIATRDIEALTPSVPFDTQKDIGFYTGEGHSVTYLHPGEFMVCFPHDAHKVAMMKDAPCEISKMVVKVLAQPDTK